MAENSAAGPGAPQSASVVYVPPGEGPLASLVTAADHVAVLLEQESDRGRVHVLFDDGDPGTPHAQLRSLLSSRGIPWPEVRLLSDAGAGLPAECRSGAVTVLVATSGLAALAAAATRGCPVSVHHLDVPRDGLAARQRAQLVPGPGGRSPASLDFRYFTPGTFDELRWAAFDQNEELIGQVFRGTPYTSEHRDPDAALVVQASFPGPGPLTGEAPGSSQAPGAVAVSGRLAARVLESIEELGNGAPLALKQLWGVIDAAGPGAVQYVQGPGSASPGPAARPGSARRRRAAGPDSPPHRGANPKPLLRPRFGRDSPPVRCLRLDRPRPRHCATGGV